MVAGRRSTASDRPGRPALGRLTTVLLLVAVVALAVFAGDALLTPRGGRSAATTPTCDPALLSELQLSSTGLCLQNVQVSVSASNSSEFVVPVMVIKPGTTFALEILYQLGSESVGHRGPRQNVTSSEPPVMLEVPSGQVSDLVRCSNGSLVFESESIVIYSYSVTVPLGSEGYYAILPAYYFGFYPALAVGAAPGHLNATALSTWGYDGLIQSAEFMLPSSVVGTGTATLVNATVPMVQACPTPACNVIAHSGT